MNGYTHAEELLVELLHLLDWCVLGEVSLDTSVNEPRESHDMREAWNSSNISEHSINKNKKKVPVHHMTHVRVF